MTADWLTFTAQLAAALDRLGDYDENNAVTLIVFDATEQACFVQYSGDGEGCWAEVVSNRYLPDGRRMSRQDKKMLSKAGWSKPVNRSSLPNWNCTGARRPTRGVVDYRRLAEMSVLGLRDALRVATPADLRYYAFGTMDGRSVEVPELGLAREELSGRG